MMEEFDLALVAYEPGWNEIDEAAWNASPEERMRMLFCQTWNSIMRLADSLGAVPMNKHAGIWQHSWVHDDMTWTVAANGHNKALTAYVAGGETEVMPYCVLVYWNGWPAGILTPGPCEFGHGTALNIVAFLRALDAAMEQVKERNAH